MITLEQSGLTQTQYDLLKDAKESPDWMVIAHQYNLEFTAHYTGSGANEDGADFDSAIANDKIYRVSGSIVDLYNGFAWSEVTGFTLPTGIKSSRPISTVGDGNDLYVFVPTLTGVSLNIYDGSSWSGWSEIITESDVEFIAATSSNKLHYIVQDKSNFRWNFKVAIDSGSWSSTASDIYWSYIITSFDAESREDSDILVFSSDTPGEVSAKYINNQVVKYIVPSGGLIGLTYKNKTWSDHFYIDVVDAKSNWRYRNLVNLSNVNGKLFITAYTSDGTESYPITAYRQYTSKDGKNWSRGEILNLPSGYASSGIKYLALGDYIFGLTRKMVYRSYSTLYTGYSPSAMQLDITDRIEQYTRSWQEMQQISMVINNEDNWIASTILDGTNRIILQNKQGYLINSPVESVLVTIGLTEIDTISFSSDLPKDRLRIVSRDFIAWMNDRTQSETYRDWEPQLIGGDDYTDTTDTGYGGLAHTASLSGSWKTITNQLAVINNNKESISMSDFTTNTWNGFAQTEFTLAQLSNNEYTGIAFRIQDKDNLDYIKYDQTNDRLEFYQRRGGIDTSIANSSTLSWSGSLSTRYIRIEFRYCRLKAYTSEDGLIWTERISTLVTGQQSYFASFHQAGGIGLIGKGFSDQDTWSGDPGSIGSGTLPPEYDLIGFLGLRAGQKNLALIYKNGRIAVTTDFDSANPTYIVHDLSATLGTNCLAWAYDARSTQNSAAGWVVTEDAIYYVSGLGTETPLVALQHTFSTSSEFRCIDASWAWNPGEYIIVSSYYGDQGGTKTIVSPNSGANWNTEVTVNSNYQTTGTWSPGVAWSPHIPGMALTTAFSSTAAESDALMYRTTTYGDSWSTYNVYAPQLAPGFLAGDEGLAGDIHIPFHNNASSQILLFGGTSTDTSPGVPDNSRVLSRTPNDEAQIAPAGFGPFPNMNGRQIATSPLNQQCIAFVGNNVANSSRSVYASSDGANNWNEIDSNTDYRRVALVDHSALFLYGVNDAIGYSENLGATLSNKTGNLSVSSEIIGITGF